VIPPPVPLTAQQMYLSETLSSEEVRSISKNFSSEEAHNLYLLVEEEKEKLTKKREDGKKTSSVVDYINLARKILRNNSDLFRPEQIHSSVIALRYHNTKIVKDRNGQK
jgi:hypothetical protein